MRRIRILIADDQKLFADSLMRVLSEEQDIIEKVITCPNGKEACRVVHESDIDVVLMDIHMPEMDGIEATKIIARKHPDVKVIMLTTYGYDDYVKQAMKNGAVGFLLKDISSDELLSAVQGANAGVRIVSPHIMDGSFSQSSSSHETKEVPEWYSTLTDREKEILLLVQKGYSNDEIAEQVFLSTQTVKNYLSSIYDKLEVENRFQAMRLAIEYRFDTITIPPGNGDD